MSKIHLGATTFEMPEEVVRQDDDLFIFRNGQWVKVSVTASVEGAGGGKPANPAPWNRCKLWLKRWADRG